MLRAISSGRPRRALYERLELLPHRIFVAEDPAQPTMHRGVDKSGHTIDPDSLRRKFRRYTRG